MDPRTERLLAARGSAPPAATGWRRVWTQSALRKWTDEHRVLAASIAAGAIGVSAALYYTLAILPVRQAEALSRAEQAAGQQRAADDLAGAEGLDACLATAATAHRAAWDEACRADRRKADCTLPRDRGSQLDERHRQARAECLKRYSIR